VNRIPYLQGTNPPIYIYTNILACYKLVHSKTMTKITLRIHCCHRPEVNGCF